MADLDDCFVAAVAARGVTIVDVAVDASGGATSQSQTFTALEPLDDFLHGPAAGQYVSRYMCVAPDYEPFSRLCASVLAADLVTFGACADQYARTTRGVRFR